MKFKKGDRVRYYDDSEDKICNGVIVNWEENLDIWFGYVVVVLLLSFFIFLSFYLFIFLEFLVIGHCFFTDHKRYYCSWEGKKPKRKNYKSIELYNVIEAKVEENVEEKKEKIKLKISMWKILKWFIYLSIVIKLIEWFLIYNQNNIQNIWRIIMKIGSQI